MTIEASHILAKYTAKDLCRNDEKHPMIQFSASDTLSTIFEKLVEAHIFAAPVLREEPDEDGRRLMGVISLLDVIDSVVEIWHQVEQMPPPDMNKGNSLLRSAVRHDQLLHLLGRSIEITTERGDTATKRAKSDLLAVIVDEAPLDAVFELMTENHIHRVFVITADGEINNVITQRDMVFFLHDHLAEFEKMWNPEKSDTFFLDETVEHLGLIYAEVKAVKASERILAAFDTMVKNNLRAVPVVTSDGIIGVISASDFHVLSNWESPQMGVSLVFWRFYSPV